VIGVASAYTTGHERAPDESLTSERLRKLIADWGAGALADTSIIRLIAIIWKKQKV
jgi:hypothetical protein